MQLFILWFRNASAPLERHNPVKLRLSRFMLEEKKP